MNRESNLAKKPYLVKQGWEVVVVGNINEKSKSCSTRHYAFSLAENENNF